MKATLLIIAVLAAGCYTTSYECARCSKTFSSEKAGLKHIQEEHGVSKKGRWVGDSWITD
jgi:hypothetical protein